ncbi:Fc receptor-like protein 5 isoform X1 [Microtus pennsylvanicus]|uniref:Fc receptor-like protein 5 isoform X1 n=1 Tax=Microtus pennsylvanicus TaxID=10058 RepID=UPI003F6D1A6B
MDWAQREHCGSQRWPHGKSGRGGHLQQLTMLLLMDTHFSPISRQYETVPKSVISLEPSWTTFFQEETVTLTCYGFGFNLPQKTKWYWNSKIVEEIQGHTFKVRMSGVYQCQADNFHLSIPAHVRFSKDPLVLRGPPAVFEGDSVVLRCDAKKSTSQKSLTFYKNEVPLQSSGRSSELVIQHADQRANGQYHCTKEKFWSKISSNTVRVQVQELFPRPVLMVRPSELIDGSPVTLACQTQLPAQKSNVQLQFCFFRNLQALGSGCHSSSEFHIPAIWTEDAMWYQCTAEATDAQVSKRSLPIRITVQRAFADFQIHIVPASRLVFEGQLLLFNCSVKGVPGPITLSWYKRDKLNKETNITKSSEAELKISRVNSSDAGDYYCEANNSRRSFVSKAVTITVKVPVARPVLTLGVPGAQTVVGDMLELHCEALEASPPILYHFYYQNVTLGISSALSGGRGSFNFSVTAEHSGNFFCEADNGQGPQRSDTLALSVIDTTKNRRVPVAAGVAGGLLAVAGMAAGVLLYCWFSRRAGGKSASGDSRNPSYSESQEPTYYNVPACIELQPVYSNDPKGEVIYTEVRCALQRLATNTVSLRYLWLPLRTCQLCSYPDAVASWSLLLSTLR